MKYTILSIDGNLRVHAAGCRDIRRELTPGCVSWDAEAATLERMLELEAASLDGSEPGNPDNAFQPSDFHVCACARR